MKVKMFLVCSTAALGLSVASGAAAAAFPEPPGGWTYMYNGDQLQIDPDGNGYGNLDGTWTHNNGSDQFDGSEIGGVLSDEGGYGVKNSPGGASLLIANDVTFLRLQDCGNPTKYGYTEPSNRKVYFGHNIGSDIDPTKALTIMRDGVTLTFRARIPTLAKAGPPLDQLYRDASGISPEPYPENGDGYVTSDGGKGNFVIREGGNGANVPAAAIAFSFTQTNDTTGGALTPVAGFAGLTFNEFAGNVPTVNVNFGQGSKTNVLAFDPTEWHELYIVIRGDPAGIGTHEAFIFLDGNLRPAVYKITGGTGADMSGSFLGMGGSSTGQSWALDVDWFGYKDEAVFPPGALLPPSIFDFAPADRAAFYPPASDLKFSTSALMPTNRLPASGIKVILNGQDISSQLTLTGNDTSQSRTVSYHGLQPNKIYAATYVVTDSGNLSVTNEISFDTFVETQVTMIEAEDYNFMDGQFFDNPQPGAYAGLPGTAGVDFRDTTINTSTSSYRSDDVDMAATTDTARNKFVFSGQTDYQVENIAAGEWCNYTRTFTAGNYYAYVRAASTTAQNLRLDRVTAGASQTNQTLEFLGYFPVPRTGNLNLFNYARLTDVQGNPVALPLSGLNTLRLTASSASDNLALNFFFLLPVGATPTAPSVAALPGAGATGVAPDDAVEIAIFDGTTPVNQGTVKLRVNGTEVAAVITKAGSVISVKYTPNQLWASGATNALNLTFNDGTDRSYDWSFTVADYPVLTPAMKVTGAATPGFVWRMHQNEANTATLLQTAEDRLSGALNLPNLADPNAQGIASGTGLPATPGNGTMTFKISGVINASQAADSSFGSFTPDEQMPGIPGTTGSTDGFAVEIKTFLELSRGFYRMGVNSDDGFQTTAGFLNDVPLILGTFDGSRGAGDTLFSFAVEESGVYAFRTVYFQATGDASIEWFVIKPDGTKVLVNDTANGGPRAYQQGTVPDRPIQDMRITIQKNTNGQVVLEWPAGTLQAADLVTGTYQTVTGATSPYTITPGEAQKFYRVLVR